MFRLLSAFDVMTLSSAQRSSGDRTVEAKLLAAIDYTSTNFVMR